MASDAKTNTRQAPRRSSMIWLQGAACGALVTFAAPTALMLMVLFAPAIACKVTELPGTQGQTRAVALACAAGALSPLWHLWLSGDHMEMAVEKLIDPLVLLTAWGAGAISWSLCQVLPVIIRSAWDFRESARSKQLEAEVAAIYEAWDLEGSTN